ncbi:PapB/FocB family fimbrial expression transcriptional regulator [Flavobacterium sp.]|jgi:hypothetical protein|uniref:PapB/FocB family fimbrial expression transcriptional regulator n=1 Tax=Flavobacterium sp. TaxID=239 RepID=UPI0037BFABB9
MRYLTQGGQTAERLQLLFSLTRIASDDIKAALSDYLVRGLSDATASSLNGVAQSNFNRALNGLEEVAATVERIKEIDWRHLKSDN